MKRLTKPRFLFVYLLVVWLFLVAHTTELQLRLGIPLVLLGAFLRFWANGYVGHVKVNWTQKERGEAKIGRLVTAGPYAFVRHPLYLGTFLIGLGFCVIVGNLWFSLVALVFFLLVYRRKMADEESMIRDEVGEAFERYQRAVPRWLPAGRRYAHPNGQWSWQGIVASKEPKTLMWLVVFFILLYFREEIIQEHEFLSGDKVGKHILLIGVALVLIAADGVFELMRRRAKWPLQRTGQSR